jgi:hypothetical protein
MHKSVTFTTQREYDIDGNPYFPIPEDIARDIKHDVLYKITVVDSNNNVVACFEDFVEIRAHL